MELSGIRLGRRSDDELDALLTTARSAALSYDHPASTLATGAAPGVADRTFTREVDGTLAVATASLRRWAPHGGIRGRIHPAGSALAEGDTLLVVAPFGPFEMAVPDRIVAVVDEPQRFGFAYGTLAGHAEAGEELFLAEQTSPGHLRLTVRVQARPATLLARLGTPLVTLLQRAAARRYLAAWAAAMGTEA
ncbi:MAG: DUF1990 family protein [Acidimicrobiales bacterium]